MDWIRRASEWWRRKAAAPDGDAAPDNGSASVMGRLALWNQIQRIGGVSTPASVSAIIENADRGYTYQLVDLGNEFRQKDCHLQSVLHTRETALAGLDWVVSPHIAPGEHEPSAHCKEVAEQVSRALLEAVGDSTERRGFTDLIAHLNGAPFFGHAEAETAWTVRDGFMAPAGFYCHSPRRFGFDLATAKLCWWDQTGPLFGPLFGPQFGSPFNTNSRIDVQAKYPGLFLLHQPRVVGDVPAREGLIRPLIWMALFKNWDIADWLRLAELAWKPWRLGTYASGATEKDKANLLEALEYLTSNGVGIFSERQKIEIRSPESGQRSQTSQHEALATFCDSAMSKAVLGQTLTTQAGPRGNRSLGEVHDRIRQDIRDNDAQAVAATIRRDLVTWITRFNYGDAEPVPFFWFVTEERSDFTTFMDGIGKAAAAGVEIPQEWVRDQAGIRQPKPGERLVGGKLYEVSGDTSMPPPAPIAPPPADDSDEDAEDVDVSDLDADESEGA